MNSDSTISCRSHFLYEPGDNCSICLDGLETKPLAIVDPCNHLFHKDCIKTWLELKSLDERSCVICQRVARALVGPDGLEITLRRGNSEFSIETYIDLVIRSHLRSHPHRHRPY